MPRLRNAQRQPNASMSAWQSGTTRKMPRPTPEPAMPRASPTRALNWRLTITTSVAHPPAVRRGAARGEQAEAHVEMPGARDVAVRPQRRGEQRAAGEDETTGPEAIGERAQHRSGAAVHQREHGEGACEDGAAPAELLQQRDEEDAVRVPDAVGESQRDDGDGERAMRGSAGGGWSGRVGGHERPTIPRPQSGGKPRGSPATRRSRNSRSTLRRGSRST